MGSRDDEYDYLFKGGAFLDKKFGKTLKSFQLFYETIKKIEFLIARNSISSNFSCANRRLGCWEVEFTIPFHSQRVQPGVEVDHRCRVRHSVHSSKIS